MNTISSKEVPDYYTLCIKSDCPITAHCLRQIYHECANQEIQDSANSESLIYGTIGKVRILPFRRASDICSWICKDAGRDVAKAI